MPFCISDVFTPTLSARLPRRKDMRAGQDNRAYCDWPAAMMRRLTILNSTLYNFLIWHVFVPGCQRYNDYQGYSSRFKWTGDIHDDTPRFAQQLDLF